MAGYRYWFCYSFQPLWIQEKSDIAIAFGVLVFCIVVFTVVDNGNAKIFLTLNDNIAYDTKEPREIFKGSAESKHVIDVNVNAIASGEGEHLGRQTLKEGDMITYGITAEEKRELECQFYENGQI